MSELEDIKAQASRIDAIISCPECSFEEPFEDYLERDERVDEAEESVNFGCPACGSDSVDLGRERAAAPNAIVVNGLEEMEELAGE
jgi:Zn finger protein HypA/HybF involved in hydrogenase expression